MCPIAIRSELGRKVFHLIGQHTVFGKEVPFIGIWFKWVCEQGHVGFFGRKTVLKPIATFAGSDHVLPFIGATSRCRYYMISRQLAS